MIVVVPAVSSFPTVYFDGGCPVCSREVATYRREPGADGMQWIDVSHCGPADVFTGLWRLLPRWAWLGRVLGRGPELWLLEAGYRDFLVVRRGWRKT